MKLPNFFKFAPLNVAKRRMGIATDVYGSFGARTGRLTATERVLLQSGEGIEVSFDQLTILSDKTLAYKDSRVLLYIRDVHVYSRLHREDRYPRYHLSNCITLQEMTSEGRFERYVVAAETGGEFILNMITGKKTRSERRRLNVCQNCLDELAFNGFTLQKDRHTRLTIVRDFTPAQFFAVYPQSLHIRKPRYTSITAPVDNYTDDFPEISRRLRGQHRWRCHDSCGRDFSGHHLRKYLQVHHFNGDRRDNRRSNLKVLCIVCHAEQPRHHHLKNDPRYSQCLRELALHPFDLRG